MKTFIDCCAFNDLSIEGSFFQHKEIHKVTLPTGSDVDSDYHRVIGMFEMKLAQGYSDDSRRY